MVSLGQFKIVGFWAKNNLEYNKAFTKGHQKVLYDHGLGFFTSNEDYWYNYNNVYVVIALQGEEVIAGLRLESKRGKRLLPLEKAILSKDNNVANFIDSLKDETIFEVCALWNSKEYANYNFVTFLCRASLAIAPNLGFTCALSLNGYYTYRIPRDIGCSMVTSIGNRGRFPYPIERFHSAVWIQNDLIHMSKASNVCQETVAQLRSHNFKIVRKEKCKEHDLIITYDLGAYEKYTDNNTLCIFVLISPFFHRFFNFR